MSTRRLQPHCPILTFSPFPPTPTPSAFFIHSARDALRQCLPDALRSDVTFAQSLKDDVTINRWLANLLYNINEA